MAANPVESAVAAEDIVATFAEAALEVAFARAASVEVAPWADRFSHTWAGHFDRRLGP